MDKKEKYFFIIKGVCSDTSLTDEELLLSKDTEDNKYEQIFVHDIYYTDNILTVEKLLTKKSDEVFYSNNYNLSSFDYIVVMSHITNTFYYNTKLFLYKFTGNRYDFLWSSDDSLNDIRKANDYKEYKIVNMARYGKCIESRKAYKDRLDLLTKYRKSHPNIFEDKGVK